LYLPFPAKPKPIEVQTSLLEKPIDASSIYNYPVQQALEKISGHEWVKGEVFGFTPGSEGNLNITINGQPTANFINPSKNTLGRAGGDASMTIVSWVAWYGIETDEYKIRAWLDELLLNKHQPIDQAAEVITEAEKKEVARELRFKLLSDLEPSTENVGWLWEGYIAKGCLTLFSATPKTGKTHVIAHLLRAIEQEQSSFLGQPLTPFKALILSEEGESVWHNRRVSLGMEGKEILLLNKPLTARPTRVKWENYVAELTKLAQKENVRCVMFDTINRMWSAVDENDATQVTDALRPLNALTREGIAVVLVHHNRKSSGGGDVVDNVRGSTALTGDADIVLNLRFPPNTDHATPRRELQASGRFDEETPASLLFERVGDDLRALGNIVEVNKHDERLTILNCFSKLEARTASKAFSHWHDEDSKPGLSTFRRKVAELEALGWLVKSEPVVVFRSRTDTFVINPDNGYAKGEV
jgi:hypothetical protein